MENVIEDKVVVTVDGKPVKEGNSYFMENGESVLLDQAAMGMDGKPVFVVTPVYEGEAMDFALYPSGHTEITCPYEHHGEPRLVNRIYADEPTQKIGEKNKAMAQKVADMAESIGSIERLKKDFEKEIDVTRKKLKELTASYSHMVEQEEAKRSEFEEFDEKINEKRQKLSELEDSCSEYEKVDSDTVTISKEDLLQLRKKEFMIECLEAGGVDNWDFYGDSLDPYRERYPA